MLVAAEWIQKATEAFCLPFNREILIYHLTSIIDLKP